MKEGLTAFTSSFILPPSSLPSLLVYEAAAADCVVEGVLVRVAGKFHGARPLHARDNLAALFLDVDVHVRRQVVLLRGLSELRRDPLVRLAGRVCGLVDRVLHEVFEEERVVGDGRVVVGRVRPERDDGEYDYQFEARPAPLARARATT